jgi:hypothetical protein
VNLTEFKGTAMAPINETRREGRRVYLKERLRADLSELLFPGGIWRSADPWVGYL